MGTVWFSISATQLRVITNQKQNGDKVLMYFGGCYTKVLKNSHFCEKSRDKPRCAGMKKNNGVDPSHLPYGFWVPSSRFFAYIAPPTTHKNPIIIRDAATPHGHYQRENSTTMTFAPTQRTLMTKSITFNRLHKKFDLKFDTNLVWCGSWKI